MLDTSISNDNPEVAIDLQTIIPTHRAVVRAGYRTSIGLWVLMVLTQANGHPVPFGAMVTTSNTKNGQRFIVGDGGQVYLTGLSQSGQLKVQWGSAPNERCCAAYRLPRID